ncbi:S26 family signal peptidase [Burkholderia cenocepacia]|uniref:S26 family signal peptidase n=1 Tax=Burkholderia cenocepacia TaxID=95486 RepID=UPI001CF103FB|nr:S26 family signal peptidase [Burkholderia cenocepacia]MCA7967040.1 S26 family signal peptidase [Burkholderia cenocepacia]
MQRRACGGSGRRERRDAGYLGPQLLDRRCSGAVLQGDRATATVDGDRIELRDGVVYVNGRSYGAVTPAQTVEYEAARDRRTLKVDGKVRTPQR